MREGSPSTGSSEQSGSSQREHEHANGARVSHCGDWEDAAGPVDERRGPKENPYSDIKEEDATDKEPGIMDKVTCLTDRQMLSSASMHGSALLLSAAQGVKA